MSQAWGFFERSLLHPAELVLGDPEGLQLRKSLEGLAVEDPDHVRTQVDRFKGRHVVQRIWNLLI